MHDFNASNKKKKKKAEAEERKDLTVTKILVRQIYKTRYNVVVQL